MARWVDVFVSNYKVALVGTDNSAKISKNAWESHAGLQILTISAVKATDGGDWVLKKMGP